MIFKNQEPTAKEIFDFLAFIIEIVHKSWEILKFF